MNRERSGEEGVCMGGSPASHSLCSRSHDALTPTRSLAEFFSDLAGSLLAGYTTGWKGAFCMDHKAKFTEVKQAR